MYTARLFVEFLFWLSKEEIIKLIRLFEAKVICKDPLKRKILFNDQHLNIINWVSEGLQQLQWMNIF